MSMKRPVGLLAAVRTGVTRNLAPGGPNEARAVDLVGHSAMNGKAVDHDGRTRTVTRWTEGCLCRAAIGEAEPGSSLVSRPAGKASCARRVGLEAQRVRVGVEMTKLGATQLDLPPEPRRSYPRRIERGSYLDRIEGHCTELCSGSDCRRFKPDPGDAVTGEAPLGHSCRVRHRTRDGVGYPGVGSCCLAASHDDRRGAKRQQTYLCHAP